MQYTNEGKINISYFNHSISITDTGLGVPKEEINHIKQAFYSLQPDGIGWDYL